MVLMRMRQEDSFDLVCIFCNEFRIGADEINTRRRIVTKGHSQIDEYPSPVVSRPVAICVQIHPDLAATAKRQENEFGRVEIGHVSLFGCV